MYKQICERVDHALDSRLILYALAASATLTIATSSHAEVGFTPSDAVLQGGTARLDIDLDHDNSTDFTIMIKHCRSASGYQSVRCLGAYSRSPSDQLGMGNSKLANALTPRTSINTGNVFQVDALMTTAFGYLGYWPDVNNSYLGVRFRVNGQVHYGWIGFRSVTHNIYGAIFATLNGWAYEPLPNKATLAGDTGSSQRTANLQPTSLEMLSFGHAGIEQRRNRTTTAGIPQ